MYKLRATTKIMTAAERKRMEHLADIENKYKRNTSDKPVRPRTSEQRKRNMLADRGRPSTPMIETIGVDADEMSKMMQEEQKRKINKMKATEKRKRAIFKKGGKSKISRKIKRKQKKIAKKYKGMKWKRETKIKNSCKVEKFDLHPTQKFLKNFFHPEKKRKGLILYHSVGSGKTCAAIAMASNFESAGYHILWVTRNSLKNVVFQNLWGQHVCHPKMIEQAKRIADSEQKKKTFNAITGHKWLAPVSYRTFSNITKGKSKVYRKLVEKNGKKDPLRKTLIIIDEAHNFTTFKPIGFSKHESAKFEDIRNMIYNSYKVSGKDSARVILLSATPGLNGAIGAINMLNLVEGDSKYRLPTKADEFAKEFITKDYSAFTKSGKEKFAKQANRYVSFLDTTQDYTKFARKIFETYSDPISRDRENLKLKLKNKRGEKLGESCKRSSLTKQVNNIIEKEGLDTTTKIQIINNILKNSDIKKEDHRGLFMDVKKLVKDCKRYKNKEEKEKCEKAVKENSKKAKDKLKQEIAMEAEKCKMNFANEKKSDIEKLKQKIEKNQLLLEKNQQKALNACENAKSEQELVKCLKAALLWSDKQKQSYKFENKRFDPLMVQKVLPIVSAKFNKLIQTIKDLDRKDRCVHKKNFKHVIFIDDYKYIKLLMSVLIANDFKLALDLKSTQRMRKGKKVTFKSLTPIVPTSVAPKRGIVKSTPKPKPHKKNFTVLTKTGIYQRNIGKNLSTKIQGQFNARPDNVYGQNVRFLILDKDFLEGVSLYDVKYLHILTDPKTKFQKHQLIGRVIRRCGHVGLPMEKGVGGWKLNVMTYHNRDQNNYMIDDRINHLELKKELKNAGERLDSVEEIIVNEMERNALDRALISKLRKL